MAAAVRLTERIAVFAGIGRAASGPVEPGEDRLVAERIESKIVGAVNAGIRRPDDLAVRRDVNANGVIAAGDARHRAGDNTRPVGEAPLEIGIGDARIYAPYG